MDPNTINSIGLLLDIAGVGLLSKYGLPSDVGPRPDDGGSFKLSGPSDEDRRRRGARWSRYRIGSRSGLGLLVFGFALQIASNYPAAIRVAGENAPLWIFATAVVVAILLWIAVGPFWERRD